MSDTETKEILTNFYSERAPDEAAARIGGLLPAGRDPAAPDDSLYLMEFDNMSVKESEAASWPYTNGRLKVVEPDDFENQGFFTTFWLPPVYADMEDKEIKQAKRQTDGLFFNIDSILGDGTAVELFGGCNTQDEVREGMEKLADMLDEERCVVEVMVRKPSKKQKEKGYTDDQNAVKSYANADSWEGEAF